MRANSKIGLLVGVAVAALLIGGGLLFYRWLNRYDVPSLNDGTSAAATGTNATQATAGATNNAEGTGEMAAADETETPEPVAPEPEGTWDQKLDTVLVSDGDAATKAAKILALMPLAPLEGKVQLAQHLVNMTEDDNYAPTGEMLMNSSTPADVSQVIMNDLLNRNNNLKLPTLLAIARNDDHPLKAQAKEMLELFIQDDKGTNWVEWESAVQTWLKDNPQ